MRLILPLRERHLPRQLALVVDDLRTLIFQRQKLRRDPEQEIPGEVVRCCLLEFAAPKRAYDQQALSLRACSSQGASK